MFSSQPVTTTIISARGTITEDLVEEEQLNGVPPSIRHSHQNAPRGTSVEREEQEDDEVTSDAPYPHSRQTTLPFFVPSGNQALPVHDDNAEHPPAEGELDILPLHGLGDSTTSVPALFPHTDEDSSDPHPRLREWLALLKKAGAVIESEVAPSEGCEEAIDPRIPRCDDPVQSLQSTQSAETASDDEATNAPTATSSLPQGATAAEVEEPKRDAAYWKKRLSLVPEDMLVIVDLQNDFVPPQGSFAVAEGDQIITPTCHLMNAFLASGATVYVSRDYHPSNHCSFEAHGGPFPPHCVQGTKGSEFVEPLVQAMQPFVRNAPVPPNYLVQRSVSRQPRSPASPFKHDFLMSRTSSIYEDAPEDVELILEEDEAVDEPGGVFVVYKGFSADVDSFGAMKYHSDAVHRSPRLSRRPQGPHCNSTWTGSYLLYSSALRSDCNAPPDVMSVLKKVPLPHHIAWKTRNRQEGRRGRLMLVGLTFDYCVLDTAVNAAELTYSSSLFSSIAILVNFTRAAYVPGLGGHGTGYLSDPKDVVARVANKVSLVDLS
jgi:nicotinamidase-related amidase